jgi:hypothetical protein
VHDSTIGLPATSGVGSGERRSEYLTQRFTGYDERQRPYGGNNDFCRKYAATERCIYALDSEVKHSLACDADEPREIRVWRHRENGRAVLVTHIGSLGSAVLPADSDKTAILEGDLGFLSWHEFPAHATSPCGAFALILVPIHGLIAWS